MKESHKLNQAAYDPRSQTIFISLRPRSQRRPDVMLDCPGKVVLDLDREGDIYGIRLVGVGEAEARTILERLQSLPPGAAP